MTISVAVIANSVGKKINRTGVNNVPNPKPEKKVRSEINKARMDIIIISIIKKNRI